MTEVFVDTAPALPEVKGRSLWADARRRFLRNKAAMFGLIAFCIVAFVSFGAPYFGLRAQDEIDWDMTGWAAPDFAKGFYLGGDANGRDMFVHVLYGGQV